MTQDMGFSLFNPQYQQLSYTFIVAAICGVIICIGLFFLKKYIVDNQRTQTNLILILVLCIVGFLLFLANFTSGWGNHCQTVFTSPNRPQDTGDTTQ
jgi:ABC-type amino acid transport system permease subunit